MYSRRTTVDHTRKYASLHKYRKNTVCFLLVLLAMVCTICINPLTSLACTSFSVYSDEIIYGMNFDFPDTKIIVKIDDYDDCNRVFSMYFEGYGASGNNSSLNDKGLFTAVQEQYPYEPYIGLPEEDSELVSGFAMWTPFLMNNVREVRAALYETPMRHVYGSFHDLFADINGDAMVLEVINGEIVKTDIQENFIVMTNFANARLKEEDYRDITEIGSDRYATAYEYISEHFSDFTVESGFEVLKKTSQHSTQYSVVHDPVNRLSYFSIKGNFDKIWKVSLDEKTLETYKGFNAQVVYSIGEDGIPLSQLIEYEINDLEVEQSKEFNILFIIVPLSACLIIIAICLLISFRKKHKAV